MTAVTDNLFRQSQPLTFVVVGACPPRSSFIVEFHDDDGRGGRR
jgi:hypothetical protein